MPTITDLRTRRDALSAQRPSGVARSSYVGTAVDYRSVAEIDCAIEALDREIAALGGVADQQAALGPDGQQINRPSDFGALCCVCQNRVLAVQVCVALG